MSKKKIEYILSVNGDRDEIYTFAYRYGSTKSAHISLHKNGFSIYVNTSASINGDMIIDNKSTLFNDAINKAIMLYLIRFNKAADINEISFSADGKKHTIPKEKFPYICIVSAVLNNPLQSNWAKVEVDQFILNYKEKYRLPKKATPQEYVMKGSPRLMASVVALLTAKSKTYEYERFLHLWMSMNGLYGFAGYLREPCGKRITNHNKTKKLTEIDKMSLLWQFLHWVDTDKCKWALTNKDKKIIADKVIRILQRIDDSQEAEAFNKLFTHGIIADDIQKCLCTYPTTDSSEKSVPYSITAKVYITFLLPYYLRCNYFHADKPIPFIATKNDKIIHVLKIVNTILEAFLTENLPLWMDADYVENQYIARFSDFVYDSQC